MSEAITAEKVTTNGHATATKVEEKKAAHTTDSHMPESHKTVVKETVVEKKQKGPVRRILPFIFLAILVAGAIYGWNIVQYNQVHETTDDAQIDADISPILTRVAGYVRTVDVAENQHVDSMQTLVTLDVQDLQIKIANAQAAVQTAEAAVRSAQAAATASRANVATADVARRKTAADLERDRTLLKGNAITQQQYDVTRAAAESAQAQYAAIQQQASAAESQIATALAQVAQRKTDLETARLQMSYGVVSSPVSGTIAKKNVEVGQYVQAGQPLMAVTQGGIWITANFKETQIESIHPGEVVEIKADAYPDVVFHGSVQSISPATGAKFALLPPDNASGNFVKVTQRIPVRILLRPNEHPKAPLRPGMSVEVAVETASH